MPSSRATGDHWFTDIAARLGPEYLRYSFTKGTEQEADFLAELIPPGARVLDVGCGNGLVGPVMRAKLGADANTSQLALTVEGALQPERARPDQDPNKQCAASDYCAAHVRRWQARTSHRGC